ncbi:ATP-binding protein [Ruegeria sp. HKCCSP346]|uniref:AlbA family DNA-binding domain-containing protein n=1 Tax=Ruegeria sp. HKCCSP346 TaxID=2794830 RepID=UPI001AE3EE98|nr:ATP-binding protein [Ruegeria sp. HKCCSP346]
MLIGKNFDDIDATTIQTLIEAGATESIYLEFKRDTYGGTDADKREFLKDVSAFSNCLGGHMIIGVREEDGAAASVSPVKGVDIDAELLRLDGIIRTAIEPKIVGFLMKSIEVDDGHVIAIQIPRSYNPPHRVIFKNWNRFFSRNAAGTYELSLEELRMQFGEQRTIEERAKSFSNERFLRIQANDGMIPNPATDSAMVMHLIPLSDFGADRRIDMATLKEHSSCFRPIGTYGSSGRFNLEGFRVDSGGSVCTGYTQIFRNGSVEAVSFDSISSRNSKRLIPSMALPTHLTNSLNSYMEGMRKIDASPPFLIKISFSSMAGVGLAVDPSRAFEMTHEYERDTLSLPPSLISEYENSDNYEPVVAEQMDFLWNAYGYERCFYYDEAGKWIAN